MTRRISTSLLAAFLVLAAGADAAFAGSLDLPGSLVPGGPQEPQVAIITTPSCTGAYGDVAVLYAAYSFTVDTPGDYAIGEPGTMSAMYLYEGGFDPDFPAANCIAASNTNPIDITVTLAPDTIYQVVVIDDTFAQAGLDYAITIAGPGNLVNCLFGDEFEDGVVDWLVLDPDAREADGNLVLEPTKRKAGAVATSLYAGCSACSIDSKVQTAGGKRSKVWILGWYQDKKNYVELTLNERNDSIVLKQKVKGRIARKQKASVIIDPLTTYDVSMGFDGTEITVSINGLPLVAMSAAGSPMGVPGFRVKKTTADVESVCVH